MRGVARGQSVLDPAVAGSVLQDLVSEETVKTHVGNILSKLQLSHRTQAVIYALKQGIVSLDDLG